MKRLVVKRKAEFPQGSRLFLSPASISCPGKSFPKRFETYVVGSRMGYGEGGAVAGGPGC